MNTRGISQRVLMGVCLLAVVFGSVRAGAAELLAIEVVNPNPVLLSPEGEVIAPDTTEAVDRLSGSLPACSGVVADGLSLLLLRVHTSNAVTFSVPSRFGRLRDLSVTGQNQSVITVVPRQASDGTWWAFGLYLAPDLVPGAAVRRTFSISAREESRTGIAPLHLENPPVLLVHGLWSNYSTWNRLRDYLKLRGFRICEDANCTVNYGPTQPAPPFDPLEAPQNQFAINLLIRATTNTLNALRAQGIAATQVDVVAHSLGGLLARSRVVLPDAERAYRRRENYQRGYFHKLITIGTPHRGTAVADFLVANRAARSFFLGGTLEEYLAASGRPIGPALTQMQTLSPALRNLGVTAGVPAHAIVGIAPVTSGTEKLLDSLPDALGLSVTVDQLLGGNGRHDTLVSRTSEAGGLAGAAVTVVRGVVHTDIDVRDTDETESAFIGRRIAQLLRAPSLGRLFGEFPAFETNSAASIAQPLPGRTENRFEPQH